MGSQFSQLLVLCIVIAGSLGCGEDHSDCYCEPNIPVLHAIQVLNFEPTPLGESSTAVLILENEGEQPLMISNMTLDGRDPDRFAVRLERDVDYQGDSFSIAPADSRVVQVVFTPLQVVESNAVLTILSNDPEFPEFEIAFTGIGDTLSISETGPDIIFP